MIKRYVMQHLDEDGELEYSFLDMNIASTDELDSAVGFGSRLSAERWMETREHQLDWSRWQVVKLDSIQPRAEKFDAPFDLTIADPLEAVRVTVELHDFYCQKVEDWLRKAGIGSQFDRPTPLVTITAPKWAGLYSSATHICHYPTVYAMMAPLTGHDRWRVTVAHEVVHAYQNIFTGQGTGHGADFYGLMKHAAGEPITRHTHQQDVMEAKRLSEKLLPWWRRQRERGTLIGLPCEVIDVKIKRKGIR